MNEGESLDRIASEVTKKHSRNVHEKGILAITSKSGDDDRKMDLKNDMELDSDSSFLSVEEPCQWICWDFGEMRVRPTH
jgi:hypothetical protein